MVISKIYNLMGDLWKLLSISVVKNSSLSQLISRLVIGGDQIITNFSN